MAGRGPVRHGTARRGEENKLIITIYGGVPPSPNELRRKYRHPRVYKKLREGWEHDIAYGLPGSWRRQELQKMAKERRMRVQVTLYHTRMYDADNLNGCLKPVLDAMVNVGYLADDREKFLELLPTLQFKSAEKDVRTLIDIRAAEG